MAAFYVTFASASDAVQYVGSLDSGAGSPSGPCNTVQLGPGSAFCGFTDSSSNSGIAVMFIGANFTFGPNSTSQANCAALRQSSTSGNAILVWNYTGTKVVGAAMACAGAVAPLTSMREGLYNGDFELDNQ